MGMAQTTGSASSMRIVRPGPDDDTMSSMPNGPDDTKMKIIATTANRRMLTVRALLRHLTPPSFGLAA